MHPPRFSALIGAILLLATSAAHAQEFTCYPNDATIDGSSGPLFDVIVGYPDYNSALFKLNGTSPTVNIVDGADYNISVAALNSSIVNMDGGYVNEVGAADTGTGNISGARLPRRGPSTNGTLNVSGGLITDGITLEQTAILITTGGEIGTSAVDDNPEAVLTFDNSSTALLDGGTIYCGINANDSSQIFAKSITIQGTVNLLDSSSLTMTGGTFGGVAADDDSTASITGGTITGQLYCDSPSVIASGTSIGSVESYGTTALNGTAVVGASSPPMARQP
jgi:hypothetical protein